MCIEFPTNTLTHSHTRTQCNPVVLQRVKKRRNGILSFDEKITSNTLIKHVTYIHTRTHCFHHSRGRVLPYVTYGKDSSPSRGTLRDAMMVLECCFISIISSLPMTRTHARNNQHAHKPSHERTGAHTTVHTWAIFSPFCLQASNNNNHVLARALNQAALIGPQHGTHNPTDAG